MLKVTVICSDKAHPVYSSLLSWKEDNEHKYSINLLTSINDVKEPGDLLFLVSCIEIVDAKQRAKFRHSLVLHAGDLPKDRGWSPHIWAILRGDNEITLSLLEAQDAVDSGAIWRKVKITFDGNELYDEINQKLFEAELKLMSWACENIANVQPIPQNESQANYLRKRTPKDSQLDINKTISEQFNQVRVCDPERYPAYFYVNGCKYKIKIEKC